MISKELEAIVRALTQQQGIKFPKREILGQGGFGTVLKAWCEKKSAGKAAWDAVKIAHSHGADGGDVNESLKNEFYIIKKLNQDPCQYIVEQFRRVRQRDVRTNIETEIMVLELCTGGSIYDWVKQHGCMPMQRLEAIYHVLIGLVHCHRHSIYHRDIKPENILLYDLNGRWISKIADFGIASDKRWCKQAAGTVLYIPPEQLIRGATFDLEKADVFCVGLLLYWLYIGKLPWATSQAKVNWLYHSSWNQESRLSIEFKQFLSLAVPYEPSQRSSALDLQKYCRQILVSRY